MTEKSEIPSCFCDKAGRCTKHAAFEPTIESMIALLGEQLDDVAKDEQSIEESKEFVSKSMSTVVFTRKDTFKEQIARAYASKEDELAHYKKRCEELESRERAYDRNERHREELALENLQLKQELEMLRKRSNRESTLLKQSVQVANEKIQNEEKSQRALAKVNI